MASETPLAAHRLKACDREHHPATARPRSAMRSGSRAAAFQEEEVREIANWDNRADLSSEINGGS